eukprot:TRINITY_DN12599_c1_g8_i2.p1 TRINITY_DN12599_c1_g8~~TRINITY_DN12599_c1_g8_i2.p1  ORF type:complete len:231 (+),score=31.58 TRINITY_DN12599_c1_g8_i2:272-964(+)
MAQDSHKPTHHQCKTCDLICRTASELQRHQRIHTGDKPFACQFCPKKFAQKGNLTVHIRSHTGDKPFECSTCGRAFTTSSYLKHHRRLHTLQPTQTAQAKVIEQGPMAKKSKRARDYSLQSTTALSANAVAIKLGQNQNRHAVAQKVPQPLTTAASAHGQNPFQAGARSRIAQQAYLHASMVMQQAGLFSPWTLLQATMPPLQPFLNVATPFLMPPGFQPEVGKYQTGGF